MRISRFSTFIVFCGLTALLGAVGGFEQDVLAFSAAVLIALGGAALVALGGLCRLFARS